MPFAAGTVRDIPVRALKLCGLTWSGQFLWFSDGALDQLVAIDPVTGQRAHRLPCKGVRTDLTTMSGLLVQVSGEDRRLRVVEPATGATVTEVPNPRPGAALSGLEAAQHGIWFGYEDHRVVELRNPDGLTLLDRIPVRRRPSGVTVSDNFLAYADKGGTLFKGGTINLVDLQARREVASYSVAGNPTGLTWDGSRIWYCDYSTLQLRAIELPGISTG
ncbi:MAG TPA: hypothetical protein VFG87_00885 [Amycolatopsis sp.]|jgi:hypothetical protein|nr:hypothetical protein [Amycolatopsis sp.]